MGCRTLAISLVLVSVAAAQEGKPDLSGPLRLPGLATVTEKVGLTPEQAPKIEALYKEATAKQDEIRKSAKDDPKKAVEAIQSARTEYVAKIKEVLDEAQDKKFDELSRPAKKKKDGK